MATRLFRAALLATMMSASLPAAALQDAEEIVVRAPMTADEIESASHAMARTLTAMTVGDQVPRWTMPICPRVEGLDAELAAQVDSAIRSIGAEAGAKIAGRRCKPNVFVVFTRESAGLAQKLADRLPAPRNRNGRIERSAFAAATGPLRWETRTSTHDARHGPTVANSAALMGAGDGFLLRTELPTTDSVEPSLIRKQTRAAIDGMMVVVDGPASEGMELAQLAEYIAMVVLARPPMSASFNDHPSILNLASYRPPGPSPLRLSEWDRAYLAGLYSAPADRSASATRSIIAQRMTETLSNN